MPTLKPDTLNRIVREIFAAAGSDPDEAACVADCLVEANLVGHDSHGVIRVSDYVGSMRSGEIVPNRAPDVVVDSDTMALLDGGSGFGMVAARRAMEMAMDRATRHGVAVVGLRNAGHVGRVGRWPMMAAEAGMVAFCFVNTSGVGVLVPPHGGIDRRLSANPVAIAVPIPGREPLLLDISTCMIAEGKVRVAMNRGEHIPDGCLIDAEGRPITDPKLFYADPPGAILPFGGHKGYALSVIVELLAGALTGGSCTRPDAERFEQGMMTIVFDPARLEQQDFLASEGRRFLDYVKSSRTTSPEGEILLPGEPEQRARAERIRNGIEIDDETWRQLMETCASLGISSASIDTIVGRSVDQA